MRLFDLRQATEQGRRALSVDARKNGVKENVIVRAVALHKATISSHERANEKASLRVSVSIIWPL
jgi:hypothetical protein